MGPLDVSSVTSLGSMPATYCPKQHATLSAHSTEDLAFIVELFGIFLPELVPVAKLVTHRDSRDLATVYPKRGQGARRTPHKNTSLKPSIPTTKRISQRGFAACHPLAWSTFRSTSANGTRRL